MAIFVFLNDLAYETTVIKVLSLIKEFVHTREPVSYTHLDVYKRQLLSVPSPLAFLKDLSSAPFFT